MIYKTLTFVKGDHNIVHLMCTFEVKTVYTFVGVRRRWKAVVSTCVKKHQFLVGRNVMHIIAWQYNETTKYINYEVKVWVETS